MLITVAFVSPWATTSSTHGSPTKYAVSAAGSLAVAITSRSRKVSRRRRVLPASETSIADGCARNVSTTSRTTGSPLPSSPRRGSVSPWPSASAFRIFASVAAPMPESVRSCSPSAAAFSSASVVTPSSRQIRAAVFGPSPGSRMNDETSPGTSARRLASASMSPVSTTSTIFASIVLPISGSSFALPSSASSATDEAVSRIRAAARR